MDRNAVGPLLGVDGVSKTYPHPQAPVQALREVSFSLRPGESACLLGPNGAGKTTLLNVMLGLTTPTSGSVAAPPGGGGDPRAIAAYLPQTPVPFRDLRVTTAVHVLVALLTGIRMSPKETLSTLEDWRLGHCAERRIRKLSGGERRLLGLACIFASRKPALILDEPTNELDPESRAFVWSKLAAVRREGRALLVVTHNVREVDGRVDRAVVMSAGAIVFDGPEAAFRQHYAQAASSRRLRMSATYATAEVAACCEGALVVKGPYAEFVGDAPSVSRVLRRLVEAAPEVVDHLEVTGASLEDAYLELMAGVAPR